MMVENNKMSETQNVKKIKETILKSRYILTLEDDWDDEGAIKPIEENYNKALDLFQKFSNAYLLWFNCSDLPEFINTRMDINAVSDGSIDIHFRFNQGRELLVSVGLETVSFFCSNYEIDGTQTSIRGTLNTNKDNAFLLFYLYQ